MDNASTPAAIYNATILEELNRVMFSQLFPVAAFLIVQMVFGVLGNLTICLAFMRKKLRTRSTQNLLVLWLGIFDLFSSVFANVAEFLDIKHYYLFPSEEYCKAMRFLATFPTLGSILVLVLIAVDRYRKVCHPLHLQLEISHTRVTIIIITVISFIFSVPVVFLYGHRTLQTPLQGVLGKDCSLSDTYIHGIFPILYEGTLVVCFVVTTLTLSIVYGRILIEIKRHKAYMKKNASVGNHSYQKNDHSRDRDWDVRKRHRDILKARHNHSTRTQQIKVDDLERCSNVSTSENRNSNIVTYINSDTSDDTITSESFELKAKNLNSDTFKRCDGHGRPNCHSTINTYAGGKDEANNEPKQQMSLKDIYLQKSINKDVLSVDSSKIASKDMLALTLSGKENSELRYDNEKDSEEASTKASTRTTHVDIHRSNGEILDTLPEDIDENHIPLLLPRSRATIQQPIVKLRHSSQSLVSLASNINTKVKRSMRANRPSLLAAIVTATFIMSYLPHLTLVMLRLLSPGLVQRLNQAALITYNIFLRSYLFNNAVNVFVYASINLDFRAQIVSFWKSFINYFRCKSNVSQ